MCPNPFLFSVSDGHPQAVLTMQPAWSQIFPGETVTLSCEVERGSAGWRFKQYRNGREEAGCSKQYSSRYGYSCTISTAQYHHSGVYWCESASGQERSNAVTLTVSNEWGILQTPPLPVFEGDSLTLRCRVRTGYSAVRIVFYKDNKELQSRAGTRLSVDRVSKSDEGSYKCRVWRSMRRSLYSSDSAEVRVSVRERPQAVLTREPAWTQIYESERVTLRCQVQGGYTDWRFRWYKAGRNAPVTQDYYSSIDGDRYTISSATRDHSGEYTCKGERRGNPSYSKTSAALTLRVSADTPKSALTREPAGEIFEGDTVTLSCVVEGGSGGWIYLWYKDRQGAPVYQTDSSSGTGAGYTISAAALSHSGEYWCGAGRGRNTSYSQYSHPIWVNVTASWQSAAAAAGFSVGFFVILLIVFTLLLLYHKIRGFPCITGGKRSDTWRGGECGIIAEVKLIKPGVSHYCHRERSDQNQDQAAGGVELSSQAQQPDSEDIVYSEIDTSKHNNTKKGGWRVVGSDHPVIAEPSDDVILPCHISPRLSAVDMEVRWFREKFDRPVHLYLNQRDWLKKQDSDYQGRTALSHSALQTGDISLHLRNLRPSDRGVYTCYADDGSWNEEGQSEVIVTGQ
ncbi:UNVERIFIED_CONTAM: hypothetical protein FKN15_058915 [Acipenser sinensis]